MFFTRRYAIFSLPGRKKRVRFFGDSFDLRHRLTVATHSRLGTRILPGCPTYPFGV